MLKNTCIEDSCNNSAIYNLSNETKGMYCSEHKKKNMINVITERCNFENCNKIPSFNYSEKTKKLYCSEHKLEGMIDISHKLCLYEDCYKRAYFNKPTEKTQLYCFEHKKSNMINLELYNKYSILDCERKFEFIIENTKYCVEHCPYNDLKQKKV